MGEGEPWVPLPADEPYPLLAGAKPFSKESQLRPGRERRRGRIVATYSEWQTIREEKRGPCRCCGYTRSRMNLHHLISRAQLGDDVPDNCVPLCGSGTEGCHESVHMRKPIALQLLAASLTDAEYAYVVGKLGEGGMARLFGV